MSWSIVYTKQAQKDARKIASSNLKSQAQRLLDIIAKNPFQNPPPYEKLIGDLAGIRVYKFRLSNQLCLLAYRILDESSLKMLTFGPHENFYRDLKRLE